MKIALISDTHAGERSDHVPLLKKQKDFYLNHFFPYLEKNNIKHIIHLGDLVHRRKYINYVTASYLRESFIQPILAGDYDFHLIHGNHDIYFRENMSVSCATELLSPYLYASDKFRYWVEPIEIDYNGACEPILLLPWICNENREKTYKAIQQTKAKIVFGHLELNGFQMYKGVPSHEGYAIEPFLKFDMVCSGHFHHKSSKGNIHYLGAAGEYNWLDWNDPRGFHIFDTDTRELTFIENPVKLFHKLWYNDDEKNNQTITEESLAEVKDKIVKVIVSARKNMENFEYFMMRVENAGPLEVSVVDDHLNFNLHDEGEIVSEAKDVLEIMRDFVKQTSHQVNADKLDQFMMDLYYEATECKTNDE